MRVVGEQNVLERGDAVVACGRSAAGQASDDFLRRRRLERARRRMKAPALESALRFALVMRFFTACAIEEEVLHPHGHDERLGHRLHLLVEQWFEHPQVGRRQANASRASHRAVARSAGRKSTMSNGRRTRFGSR